MFNTLNLHFQSVQKMYTKKIDFARLKKKLPIVSLKKTALAKLFFQGIIINNTIAYLNSTRKCTHVHEVINSNLLKKKIFLNRIV